MDKNNKSWSVDFLMTNVITPREYGTKSPDSNVHYSVKTQKEIRYEKSHSKSAA